MNIETAGALTNPAEQIAAANDKAFDDQLLSQAIETAYHLTGVKEYLEYYDGN